MSKTKWPDEVPVLEADDICQGPFEESERRCTVAWAVDAFGISGDLLRFDGHAKVIRKLCDSAAELHAAEADDARRHQAAYIYSDCLDNSTALVARIWNRAMCALGYTEGNPEYEAYAKPLKPHRSERDG